MLRYDRKSREKFTFGIFFFWQPSVNLMNTMWTLDSAIPGWDAWIDPFDCGTDNRQIVSPSPCISVGIFPFLILYRACHCTFYLLNVHLLNLVVLKNECLSTRFPNQVEDRHVCRCQRRDFHLGKVQSPQNRRKISWNILYLPMYVYMYLCVCVYLHMYAYYLYVFVCMHVYYVYTCVYI